MQLSADVLVHHLNPSTSAVCKVERLPCSEIRVSVPPSEARKRREDEEMAGFVVQDTQRSKGKEGKEKEQRCAMLSIFGKGRKQEGLTFRVSTHTGRHMHRKAQAYTGTCRPIRIDVHRDTGKHSNSVS